MKARRSKGGAVEAAVQDFTDVQDQPVLDQPGTLCVIGTPCDRHEGVVHGQEAEELRRGIEQILGNIGEVGQREAGLVLANVRKSLNFLLDHIDARDSLAFREATDPKDRGALAPSLS